MDSSLSNNSDSKFSLHKFNIIPGLSDRSFNIFILIIIITIFLTCLYGLSFFNKSQENMSGGTLTQLFAQDSQDTYLKSNVDNIATGKFNLYWNQPTKVANSFLNRGSPLPPPQIPAQVIGDNNYKKMNKKNNFEDYVNNSVNINNQVTNNDVTDNQDTVYQPQACATKCRNDPASCGNGSGGYRLEDGFVDATTAKPYVSLQGNIYYPDSYVGSYFINPIPDIMKPYPIVLDKLQPIRMG